MIELTPELEAMIAQRIMENRPYLYELEQHVAAVFHGAIEVKLEIRAGSVEKMTFTNHKSWIREKIDPKSQKWFTHPKWLSR